MASRIKLFSLTQSFFLAVLFTLSCAQNTHALEWQNLNPGFSYLETSFQDSKQQPITLHAIKVDLKKFDLKPITAGGELKTVKEMALVSGAAAVINANFFDTNNKALGYIRIANKTLQKPKNISWWSIFCVKNQRAKIIHTKSFANSNSCENGLQAGPRILINGNIPKLKADSSRKSLIGLDQNGNVYLIMAQTPVNATDLASFIRKPKKSGGLALRTALNLDGGSSSQLHIQTEKFTKTVPSFLSIPVGLGVFPKN